MTPPPCFDGLLHFAWWVNSSALAVMAFGRAALTSTLAMFRGDVSRRGSYAQPIRAFVGSWALNGQGNVYYEVVSIVIAIYTFGRMLGEFAGQDEVECSPLGAIRSGNCSVGGGVWRECSITEVSWAL